MENGNPRATIEKYLKEAYIVEEWNKMIMQKDEKGKRKNR